MAKYVCTSLVAGVCERWQEFETVTDVLAITPQQADEILVSMLLVFVSAYGIRQILNVIFNRRY